MVYKVLTAVVLSLLLVGVATSSAAPAVGAPNGCLVVGWTTDHASRITTMAHNNSTIIGTDFTVQTDCGEFALWIDGYETVGGSERITVRLTQGNHDIEVVGDNWSVEWKSIDVFPASDIWIGENYHIQEETISVTSEELWWDEIMAHILTFVVLYFLSTTVVYNVARWRVDRTVEAMI